MPTTVVRRSLFRLALPVCAALLASCASSGPDSTQTGAIANEPADPTPASAAAPTSPPDDASPADAGGGSAEAATFVCDTIQSLRSDYAGVEDDLTTGAWINGFIAALSDAPEQGTYSEIVEGRADAASSARCPADWAEFLARADITTLEGIDR